jgi:hypothetical protein
MSSGLLRPPKLFPSIGFIILSCAAVGGLMRFVVLLPPVSSRNVERGLEFEYLC